MDLDRNDDEDDDDGNNYSPSSRSTNSWSADQ